MKQQDIENLVLWYQKNKRDLPWRHTKDAYKIWISEIMLQQTRVEAVKRYYEVFLKSLPTVYDLAQVSDDELLKLWEGLGYYSRARNLKKCASELVRSYQGVLPDDEKELLSLPGIGEYTAGAILSIAYLKPVPAIDGNVMRVLSRVYEDERDMLNSHVRKEYSEILRKFIKKYPPDDFTQSFIELGAVVCVPNGTPLCEECPLKRCCKAHRHHKELFYPVKSAKKPRKIISKTVFVFEYCGRYSILKKEEGLLSGTYEFPNVDEKMCQDDVKKYLAQQGCSFSKIVSLGEFKHIFSHLEWHMNAYVISLQKPFNDYLYVELEEIKMNYSIPSAFQKILEKI